MQALPLIRRINPEIPVMARTKFSTERDKLRIAGVDIIVLDEEESGRAAVRRALRVFERTGSAPEDASDVGDQQSKPQ